MKLRIATVIAAVLFVASSASALPITLTLDSSLLFGVPGTAVTFVGTVSDTGNSPTFLNSDSVSVSPPLAPDDTPFFTNFPAILSPMQQVKAPILSVFIPLATAAGLYNGTLQLLGGASPDSDDILASVPFAVQVQAAVQPVPEPASAVLLLLGAATAAMRRASRRNGAFEQPR